ncbi:MAG: hypothetical protein Q4A71_02695 [Actinomycetaceae bacterium]|nr:hypothetical protein [Actinomycetaceae bacterium]
MTNVTSAQTGAASSYMMTQARHFAEDDAGRDIYAGTAAVVGYC